LCLIIIACNSNSHDKVDPEKTMKLSREGADLMMIAMQIETSNFDSLEACKLRASIYYRQATDKFLEALKYDPMHGKVGLYLPDLYYKLNKPDSALYWKKKLEAIK